MELLASSSMGTKCNLSMCVYLSYTYMDTRIFIRYINVFVYVIVGLAYCWCHHCWSLQRLYGYRQAFSWPNQKLCCVNLTFSSIHKLRISLFCCRHIFI